MSRTKPTYSKEEFARRGDRAYERSIAPHLTAEDAGKFVDVDSGAYAVDADERRASELLRERQPEAEVWLRRVGSRHVRRFGGHAGPGA